MEDVKLEKFGDQDMALKFIEMPKNPGLVQEMVNEVLMYHRLVDLQGNGIPGLLCHGLIGSWEYYIGVSVCGIVPASSTIAQKTRLTDIPAAVHSHDVLHHDIKRHNILVDDHGDVWTIDSGFAIVCSSADDKVRELVRLCACIEEL